MFVTGASKGIGAAIAAAASDRGATVGLVARNADDLNRVLHQIGGRGAVAVADVTDRHQVDAAFAALTAKLGSCDVLVNNAGIGAYGALAHESLDVVERLMAVNYLGSVYATTAALGPMIERRKGHVVFVGSVAGRLGTPFEAAYGASKFAVAGLAEALSIELSAFGIAVSLVNPGPVHTEFFTTRGHPYTHRTPRPVTAEEVAKAVVRVVQRRGFERTRPRWLRAAQTARVLVPVLYRFGTRRRFRRELRELAERGRP